MLRGLSSARRVHRAFHIQFERKKDSLDFTCPCTTQALPPESGQIDIPSGHQAAGIRIWTVSARHVCVAKRARSAGAGDLAPRWRATPSRNFSTICRSTLCIPSLVHGRPCIFQGCVAPYRTAAPAYRAPRAVGLRPPRSRLTARPAPASRSRARRALLPAAAAAGRRLSKSYQKSDRSGVRIPLVTHIHTPAQYRISGRVFPVSGPMAHVNSTA